MDIGKMILVGFLVESTLGCWFRPARKF